MNWALLISAVLLAAIVAFSVYYYFRYIYKRKKKPLHKEYIWLGEGEHPLKGRKEEK